MAQRYPSWQRQEELWHGWRDYLLRWRWEWRCTFTLPDTLPHKSSRAMFLAWLRDLESKERMNVAGYVFGCFSRRFKGSNHRHIHLHVLLLGRSRNPRLNRTLKSVSRYRWRDRWQEIVQQRMRFMFGQQADGIGGIGGISKIVQIDDQHAATSYHGQQFMPYKNARVEHESFGDDLLRREMNRLGGDNWDGLLNGEGPVIGSE